MGDDSITPDFLKRGDRNNQRDDAANDARKILNDSEQSALNNSGSARFGSAVAGKSSGKDNKKNKSAVKKVASVAGASIAIVVLVILGFVFLIFSIPLVVLASIDYGLQESLGFDATSAIIEEQAEHVLAEQMTNGAVNAEYALDLEKQGALVGQQTANGDFVRTNTYLADTSDGKVVASNLGNFNYNTDSGELAILFEGEVVTASNFVSAVESNPRFYAAFKEATDATSRYYYSKEVGQVYQDFGISRNNYSRYKSTGNIQEDKEQFDKIFTEIISKVARVGLNGYDKDCPETTAVYDEKGVKKEGCVSRNFSLENSNYNKRTKKSSGRSSNTVSGPISSFSTSVAAWPDSENWNLQEITSSQITEVARFPKPPKQTESEARAAQGGIVTQDYYVYSTFYGDNNTGNTITFVDRKTGREVKKIQNTGGSWGHMNSFHYNDGHILVQGNVRSEDACFDVRTLEAVPTGSCKSKVAHDDARYSTNGLTGQGKAFDSRYAYILACDMSSTEQSDSSAVFIYDRNNGQLAKTLYIPNTLVRGEIEDVSIDENGDMYLFYNMYRNADDAVAFYKVPNGVDLAGGGGTYVRQEAGVVLDRGGGIIDNVSSGDALVDRVADSVGGEYATEKAATLLNTAVSANEPYIAAGTFVALEEALNKARIDGDGPVDPVMNILSERNMVTVTDVTTGEDVSISNSISGTRNFVAAVSNDPFKFNDAYDYSRDRVSIMTDSTATSVINETTMSSDDSDRFNILIRMQNQGDVNRGVIDRSTASISSTFFGDTLKTTKSVIGGNRIVMGGSFLSNSINQRVIGAMPSDRDAISRYKKEVDTVLARRVEADRATRSPFDISSPHTFFGGLFRKMGIALIKNMRNSTSIGDVAASSLSTLVDESVGIIASPFVSAVKDNSFLVTGGDCPTVNSAADVEGDIYCTSHNTVDTTRMNWTLDDYKVALADSLDENGEIKDESGLAQFIVFGMGRESTVGIQDADICERWGDMNFNIFQKIGRFISGLFSLHEACDGISSDVALGSQYALSNSNGNNGSVSLYTSYVLYDTVSSLLAQKKSSTTAFKEKYYAKYPRDDSATGVIARRTGMSEVDAEIALAYQSYLIALAQYNPLGRYAFGQKLVIDAGHRLLIDGDGLPKVELAAADRRIIYRDLRSIVTLSA